LKNLVKSIEIGWICSYILVFYQNIEDMKAKTNIIGVTVLVVAAALLTASTTTTTNTLGSILGVTLPINQKLAFAQANNATSSSNVTGATTTTIPTLTKPGEKEFYVFTVEIPDVEEEKLKVAGDAFSLTTLTVNKGDKVTVHFYNVDPVKTERHSFTIGAPYNIDKDLLPGQSAVASFTADHEGIFQYYCKYHLPVMIGQLEVVP
jgi:plastocyanin